MRALAGLLAAGLTGCSFDIPSLAPDPAETTGSLRPAETSPLSGELDREDWRRARSALAVALDPQGAGSAVTWENPDSRRRGVFTPVGKPFVKSHEICRAFEATVTLATGPVSLLGVGCRLSGDDWEVTQVTPKPRA